MDKNRITKAIHNGIQLGIELYDNDDLNSLENDLSKSIPTFKELLGPNQISKFIQNINEIIDNYLKDLYYNRLIDLLKFV